MKPTPHRSEVIATPWSGVYGMAVHSGRQFHRHWHATFGIGLIDAGAQRSASGRGVVDAFAGDVITTNPGEVHDGRPLAVDERGWRIVYLDAEVLAAQVVGPDADGPAIGRAAEAIELTRPVIADPRLRHALLGLLTRLRQWQPGALADAQRACDEALAWLCGCLLDQHARGRPPAAGAIDLRHVRERLLDEHRAPPDLAELAAMEGLSRYQLLRRFQQAYGSPPHAWLLQQRTERARQLIARGESLSAAAAQAGFADQSHMTRQFARSWGFTPGQWQAAVAGTTLA